MQCAVTQIECLTTDFTDDTDGQKRVRVSIRAISEIRGLNHTQADGLAVVRSGGWGPLPILFDGGAVGMGRVISAGPFKCSGSRSGSGSFGIRIRE